MRKLGHACIVFLALVLSHAAIAADWKATESEKHYAISGTNPIALYQSIGEKGPEPKGGKRTIAHTTWDLKWRRDYQRQEQGCILASALPFLKIIYTLPKPSSKLSGAANASWRTFYNGIKTHELQHGAMVRTMTQTIINETVGLTTKDDNKNCSKLRAKVLANVKSAFENYTSQSNAFDRDEMSNGGNVQQLVLGLVNG